MSQVPLRYRVPRGSEERGTGHMEQFQMAWVSALAAASGSCVYAVGPVDEGIDVHLTHLHAEHTAHSERRAAVYLQLKATTLPPSGGYARAQMTLKRFREFAVAEPTINQIVVILAMQKRQEHWVFDSGRSLNLYGSCHWVNLAGMDVPEGDDGSKVTVKAPLTQVMDDVALALILERIGKGQRP